MATGPVRDERSSFTESLRAWHALEGVGKGDVLSLRDVPAPLVESGLGSPRDAPRVVPVALATLVKASERLPRDQAEDLIERLLADNDADSDPWIAEAFEITNRAIAAYRVVAWDPYAGEVAVADARAIRVGYGDGEAVLEGAATRSVEIARPRAPHGSRARQTELRASGTVALVLTGRGEILDAEELMLRAQLDLAHGRVRLGLLGLDNALSLLARAFADGGPALIAELQAILRPLLDDALSGARFDPGPPEHEQIIDAALRARSLIERTIQEQRLVRSAG